MQLWRLILVLLAAEFAVTTFVSFHVYNSSCFGDSGCVVEYRVRTVRETPQLLHRVASRSADQPLQQQQLQQLQQQAEMQVCFQAYADANCQVPLGPKQCGPQSTCLHTDQENGIDESTIQTCYPGVVELQLYNNTATCEPNNRLYAVNITTGQCRSIGGGFIGILTCGEFCWFITINASGERVGEGFFSCMHAAGA